MRVRPVGPQLSRLAEWLHSKSYCGHSGAQAEPWHQKRKENWQQAKDVLSGRNPLRAVTYPALPIADIQDRIAQAGGRAIVVSAHYSLYFLLLTLPAKLGLDFVAFVSRNTLNYWKQNARWLPPNVELTDNFSLDYLRTSRARCFFVMADIHHPDLPNVYVPFHGHVALLTAGWARLAKMLRLDIIPAIAHYQGDRLELMLDYIVNDGTTPYQLIVDTVDRLSAFMARDLSLWENREWISQFPRLPPSYTTPEVKSELMSLAACDLGVAKALSALIQHQ